MVYHLHNFTKRGLIGLLAILFFGVSQTEAQTNLGSLNNTSLSCNLSFPVCDGDTVRLAPTNTSGFTNFQWYYNSVSVANEINGPNAMQGVHEVSNDTLFSVAPGGTYILTAEYSTPTGCMALNDTITLDYQTVPDLVMIPDTICVADSETTDLSTLVTDNNALAGTTSWFTSLADAESNTGALPSTVVNPGATTKYYVRKTSNDTGACFSLDSTTVVVSCLSLGNLVWYDTDNDGLKDGAENPMVGVDVNLFFDANGNGTIEGAEETAISTVTTDGSGLYLFDDLKEGNYFVGIPATQFGSGEPLQYLYSSQTTRANDGTVSETTANDADANNSDIDDNGTTQAAGFYAGGVLSAAVELTYGEEPESESPDNGAGLDDNNNLTVDFGFYGMSIGSLVFSDVNNNGINDSESGIAGVVVNLYSGDGVTLISSVTTDANGQYLFPNLPGGDYIVAIETPMGTLSSDDIATSSTPNSTDNDDNGIAVVGNEIRSAVVTLTPGGTPTGESDQGTTTGAGMGDPGLTDNANTPDANSNLHIDFGVKPVCISVANATGAQSICAGDTGSNITAEISSDDDIRFVVFTTQQTGNAMYTGGTDIETVTPSGATAPYTATYTFNTADFANASNTASVTYYVYAILDVAPSDPTCRPYEEIQVVVNPLPTATLAALTLCETISGGGTAVFTLSNADADILNGQTGMTVTYHASQGNADANASPVTAPTASNGDIFYSRVENADGCYATATVTLTVDPLPTATPASLTLCETISGIGTSEFTLTNASTDVLNGQTNMTVTYHASQGNADANASPITTHTASNGDVVYVRVENTDGCYATAAITLNVDPLPTATAASLTLCETTSGGGTSVFTLANADTDVLNGQTNMTVTYYETQAQADAATPVITTHTASNGDVVYVRVENTDGCYATAAITLNVDPLPTATAASLTACEATPAGGTFEFTLADADTDVLTGQMSMTVTYHATQAEADAGAPAITTYTASNGDVVYVRVENADGCYATETVTLNVNTRPVFTLALPDACPGENPTALITLGAGADADPSVSVNAGAGFNFSTLTGGILETTNGLIVGSLNTVVLTNSTGCDATQTVTTPTFEPEICVPVTIDILNR